MTPFQEILDHGKPPSKVSLNEGIKNEGVAYEVVKKDLNSLTKEEQMEHLNRSVCCAATASST